MENKKGRISKFPPWIRVKISHGEGRTEVNEIINKYKLHTVCQEAGCPNIGECWHKKTATFMILGEICTRNCKFCGVRFSEKPSKPDEKEPENIALAVNELGLKYVVVTSVTRDDLEDEGANQFAKVIKNIGELCDNVGVEVLTPDFSGRKDCLKIVLDEKPAIFNHNIETVERLTPEIRNKADFRRSLKVLKTAFEMTNGNIPVKTGFMVGLGETDEEVKNTIKQIKNTGASILTIGQYLRPTENHLPVERYVEPEKFEYWQKYAEQIGFSFVASSPLVRSSFNASEAFKNINL